MRPGKKELRPGPKGNSSNVYRLDFSSAGDSLGVVQIVHPGAGDSPHSAGDSLGVVQELHPESVTLLNQSMNQS
jgi:hypothetical protein